MPDAADTLSSETLIISGEEPLKSLGEIDGGKVRVGAYAIRFATADEKDLTGDYFTKSTDFGPTCGDGVAAMFNHGLPLAKGVKALADVAEMTFGPVKTTRDEIGVFVEHTLDTSDAYQKAIADLCAKGKLKWSSGTASHILRKGENGEIKRWHIAEVSYTPKPAEPRLPAIAPLKSIGENFSAELAQEIEALVDTTKSAAPQPPAATQPAIIVMHETAAPTAREVEIKEMKAVATHFKCVEVGEDFIHLGKSLSDLREHIAANVVKAQPVITKPDIGMSKKEVKAWSFLKAMREAHAGRLSGLEKEASDATAAAIKKTPNGFFIPHDIASANIAESHDLGAEAIKALISNVKTLNHTTFGSGGALVGTNLLTGSIIELLRNKPLVATMGAMSLTGLVGNIAIPRISGGATAYWLNETGSATGSDQAFEQLGLTPKRLVGRTGYTKELMNQTDLSVEALVRNDLTTVLALAKDLAAINGAGGAEPLGILNQPSGLNSVTFGAAATRAKLIEFQSTVAADNASRGALAYMTTPASAAKQMNIPETQYSTKFIWDGNIDQGTVVGRPAFSTNQVPGDKVIYGNWNDLILADWAGIDVVVNPYTNDATGVVTITITLWSDVGVRHVVSFAVSTDSGAQ